MKKIIHPLEKFELKVYRFKWQMGFNILAFTLFFFMRHYSQTVNTIAGMFILL